MGHAIPLLLAAAVLVSGAAADSVWLDVPFVRQSENGCGSASLAMLMAYWAGHHDGVAAPPAVDIQRELYSAEAKGIYASAAETYLRHHGFRTFAIEGRWEDLQHHLAKGRPLLVALGGGLRHYVIAAGIDERCIAVNDPARGKLVAISRPDFEKQWAAAHHWLLLAVPVS